MNRIMAFDDPFHSRRTDMIVLQLHLPTPQVHAASPGLFEPPIEAPSHHFSRPTIGLPSQFVFPLYQAPLLPNSSRSTTGCEHFPSIVCLHFPSSLPNPLRLPPPLPSRPTTGCWELHNDLTSPPHCSAPPAAHIPPSSSAVHVPHARISALSTSAFHVPHAPSRAGGRSPEAPRASSRSVARRTCAAFGLELAPTTGTAGVNASRERRRE
jgi:hypothetical protein